MEIEGIASKDYFLVRYKKCRPETDNEYLGGDPIFFSIDSRYVH